LSKINMATALMLYRISYNIIIFVPKAGTLPYLILFLNLTLYSSSSIRDIRGSQIYISGPWTPPSGKIFVSEASILQHVIVFLISLSSSSSFRDNRRVPNLH